MKCDQLARSLAEYAEGNASGSLCEEIGRHLANCAPCAELRRDLASLQKLCRESAAAPLPHDVRQRVLALLRDSGK